MMVAEIDIYRCRGLSGALLDECVVSLIPHKESPEKAGPGSELTIDSTLNHWN